MKDRLPAYFQLQRYGIAPEDVARTFLHCEPSAIQPRVILMPNWRVGIFASVTAPIAEVSEGLVWQLTYRGRAVSVIRAGIGAPRTGEAVLALGCTPCERIVFTGSAGGLLPEMSIGELMLPAASVCGDGFSRYLCADVPGKDCFLQTVAPDAPLMARIQEAVTPLVEAEGVALHRGAVFSTDSIIGQFARVDYIRHDLGCCAIEMETAATFRAAALVGIRAAALLQLSDVIPAKQTVFSRRPATDMERRERIRANLLARAVLEALVR